MLEVVPNITECGEYPWLTVNRASYKLYCLDNAPTADKSKAGVTEFPTIHGDVGNLDIKVKVQGDFIGMNFYGTVFGKEKKYLPVVSK